MSHYEKKLSLAPYVALAIINLHAFYVAVGATFPAPHGH